RGASHCRRRAYRDVQESRTYPSAVLQEMRRALDEQTSFAGTGGRLCGDVTDADVHAGRPRELRGDGSADAGRTPQAQGFSEGVWRLRGSCAGVSEEERA